MTFRNKLVFFQISIIAMLAIVLAIVQVLFFQNSYPRMVKDLSTKARFCVKTLSATVDLGVAADDRDLIIKELGRCSQSGESFDPDFGFAVVLDTEGRMVAGTGQVPESFVPRKISREIGLFKLDRAFLAGAQLVFEGKPLGSVWAQYSTGTIDGTRQMFHLITIVGLIVVIASCLISVFFIFRLVKPLNSMIGFVHKVARGELNARLKVKAKDELATLAGDLNEMTSQIEHRVSLGEALFQASRNFMSINETNLGEVLSGLGVALGAHQAYVVCRREEDSSLDVSDYWNAPGWEPRQDLMHDLPTSAFPWVLQALDQADHLLIPDLDDLPLDALPDKKVLKAGNMRTILIVPVRSTQGITRGFMVFCAAKPARPWTREDTQAVQMIAEQLGIFWERKKAEDELRNSEERFKILFEYAPDAYYLNDLYGNFVDGNKAVEDLFGYRKEELIGMNMIGTNMISDTGLVKAAAGLQKNFEGEAAEINGLTLKKKDGGRVVVDIRSFPVKVGDQDLVLGIARDITARQRAEKERQALEDRLRQFQKMEAVGQLAGGVAHEINNPLGVILGFAQSLCKQLNDNDQLAMPLRSIEREALRCKTLVADLLSFSRKSNEAYELIEVERLLHSTSSLVKNQAKVKLVDLVIDCPPGLPRIVADHNRMQQVLVNLANNSIDAMPEGGILTIQAIVNGSMMNLVVSDTGGGIPPEVQERMLEPFYTTKEVGQGTGLGLSLAYEIVQQHGGTLGCNSEIGKGTTFTIGIPQEPASDQALAS